MARARHLATQLSRRAYLEGESRRIAEALIAEEGSVPRAAVRVGCSKDKVWWHARRVPELARLLPGPGVKGRERWRRQRRKRVLPEVTGAEARLRALVLEAVAEARGCVRRTAESLGLLPGDFFRYLVRFPEARALAAELRRREHFAPWLIRASAVLDHAPMIEDLIAAAEGLSLEEIAAEVEASQHAGTVNAQALAQAIYAAVGAAGE